MNRIIKNGIDEAGRREPIDRPRKPVRLLALDVDGTILDPNSALPGVVRDSLQEAERAGIKVVLCTGRRYRRAVEIARLAGLENPMVCNSGATVKCARSGQTLHRADHGPEELRQMIEVFQEHGAPIISFLDSGEDGPDFVTARYPSGCDLFDQYLEENQGHGLIEADWLKRAGEYAGHFHVCAAGTKEKMAAIARDLKSRQREEHQIFVQKSPRYVAWMCEVLRPDASKWTGLERLAGEWGIGPEEICAVGDDANDVPMIARAGWGVAMGHAEDFVKREAHWVAPDNRQHGVVEVVKRIMEIGE